MKNKILIKVYVAKINIEYEMYIPSNERIKKVLDLIVKLVYELCDSNFIIDEKHYLLDPNTAQIYLENMIVRETNIKNSKKIILI